MQKEPIWDLLTLKKGRWAPMPVALVLDQSISAEAKLVFALLASYRDKHGQAWPAMGTLAKRLGLNLRTVQRHIKTLDDAGYVVREQQTRIDGRGGLAPNRYFLLYPPVTQPATTTPDAVVATPSNATPDAALPLNPSAPSSLIPPTETQCFPMDIRTLSHGSPNSEHRCGVSLPINATFRDKSDATPGAAETIPSELTQREPAQSRARAEEFFEGKS